MLSLLLCAVMLLGFVPAFAIAADTTSPTASITAVSGTVRVKRGNSEKDISAFLGMKIKKDDTITTGAKGAVTVDIGDDKVIKASANSSFSVTSLTDKNGVAAVGFTLIYGTVYNAVSKAQSSDDNYTVKAGNTVMGVRGTQFTVSYFVDKDGVAKYRVVTIEGTVYTRTLVPKLMSDNNNILDIQEGEEVGLGQSAAPGTGVVEIPLEELDRSELELILEDENAPEELRDAVKEILDNLPPVKDEETPPPSKVVYEEEQPRPTPTGGSTSGQSSTPSPSVPPPPALSQAAQDLMDAIHNANDGDRININGFSFPSGVISDDIGISLAALKGIITLVIDTNTSIGSSVGSTTGSIIAYGSPTVPNGGLIVELPDIGGYDLTINGTLEVSGLIVGIGKTVYNNSNNTLNLHSTIPAYFYGENYGTIENATTGKIVISGSGYSFINNGTILNEGEIVIEDYAEFTNGVAGEITSSETTGIINIDADSTLSNSGEINLELESVLNNAGEFKNTNAPVSAVAQLNIYTGAKYIAAVGSDTIIHGGTILVSGVGNVGLGQEVTRFEARGTTIIEETATFTIKEDPAETGTTLTVFTEINFSDVRTLTFMLTINPGSPSDRLLFATPGIITGPSGASIIFTNSHATATYTDQVGSVAGGSLYLIGGVTQAVVPANGITPENSKIYNSNGTGKFICTA